MKTAAIALAAVALLAAGAAAASERVTDLDYLKASRCKGLATGLGSDTAGFDAFLKEQGRSRSTMVIDRADTELTRGKREASRGDAKARLSAEVAGPCVAYTGSSKDMASSRQSPAT